MPQGAALNFLPKFVAASSSSISSTLAFKSSMQSKELIITKTNSSSKVEFISHEQEYGKAFEDPMRRTPSIEKIVSLTGIKPSKKLDEMIEEIVNYKLNLKK